MVVQILAFVFIVLVVLFIILWSVTGSNIARLAWQIDYLNDQLNENNLNTYIELPSSVYNTIYPKTLPSLKKMNFTNSQYQRVAKEYMELRKFQKVCIWVLLPPIVILVAIMLVFYRSWIIHFFESPH